MPKNAYLKKKTL